MVRLSTIHMACNKKFGSIMAHLPPIQMACNKKFWSIMAHLPPIQMACHKNLVKKCSEFDSPNFFVHIHIRTIYFWPLQWLGSISPSLLLSFSPILTNWRKPHQKILGYQSSLSLISAAPSSSGHRCPISGKPAEPPERDVGGESRKSQPEHRRG